MRNTKKGKNDNKAKPEMIGVPTKKRAIGSEMSPEQRKRAIKSLGRAERHNRDVASKIERARTELARIMAPRLVQ